MVVVCEESSVLGGVVGSSNITAVEAGESATGADQSETDSSPKPARHPLAVDAQFAVDPALASFVEKPLTPGLGKYIQ